MFTSARLALGAMQDESKIFGQSPHLQGKIE